jgi:hypothetical protein
MMRCAGFGVLLAAGASPSPASEAVPRVCYVRTYDAAHLARHPEQQVTKIGVAIAYRAGDSEHPIPYAFTAKIRDRDEVLRSHGDCAFRDEDGLEVNTPDASILTSDAAIWCSAENDRGGLVIERKGKAGKALIKLEPMKHLKLTGSCGSESCAYDLLPGLDDKTFLVDRVSDAVCREMLKSAR